MLLFLLLLLVSPYFVTHFGGPLGYRFQNHAERASSSRALNLFHFYLHRSFHQSGGNVRDAAAFCFIPHPDHLSHGRAGDPRSRRCSDCTCNDANPFLPDSDADLFSARQHLFRNEPRGFRRSWGRSRVFTLSGTVPVLRHRVDVLCNQAEFVCETNLRLRLLRLTAGTASPSVFAKSLEGINQPHVDKS